MWTKVIPWCYISATCNQRRTVVKFLLYVSYLCPKFCSMCFDWCRQAGKTVLKHFLLWLRMCFNGFPVLASLKHFFYRTYCSGLTGFKVSSLFTHTRCFFHTRNVLPPKNWAWHYTLAVDTVYELVIAIPVLIDSICVVAKLPPELLTLRGIFFRSLLTSLVYR